MSMTLIWTIVLVVAIVIEALTIDLVSIWFALGAVVALIAETFHVDVSIQVILFTAVSLLSAIITRPLAKKYLRGNVIKTNYDRAIGKHCLVTETITPDNKGEVKVMGTLWLASSLGNEVIEAGAYAEVVSIEGAHVVVKKI